MMKDFVAEIVRVEGNCKKARDNMYEKLNEQYPTCNVSFGARFGTGETFATHYQCPLAQGTIVNCTQTLAKEMAISWLLDNDCEAELLEVLL